MTVRKTAFGACAAIFSGFAMMTAQAQDAAVAEADAGDNPQSAAMALSAAHDETDYFAHDSYAIEPRVCCGYDEQKKHLLSPPSW